MSGSSAKITSAGGNVTVTGICGGTASNTAGPDGIDVLDGAEITAGGQGLVTVTGYAGPEDYSCGIWIYETSNQTLFRHSFRDYLVGWQCHGNRLG